MNCGAQNLGSIWIFRCALWSFWMGKNTHIYPCWKYDIHYNCLAFLASLFLIPFFGVHALFSINILDDMLCIITSSQSIHYVYFLSDSCNRRRKIYMNFVHECSICSMTTALKGALHNLLHNPKYPNSHRRLLETLSDPAQSSHKHLLYLLRGVYTDIRLTIVSSRVCVFWSAASIAPVEGWIPQVN